MLENELKPRDNILKKSYELLDSFPGGLYFFIESFLNQDEDPSAFNDAGLAVLEELLEFLEVDAFALVESDAENVDLFVRAVIGVWLHLGLRRVDGLGCF